MTFITQVALRKLLFNDVHNTRRIHNEINLKGVQWLISGRVLDSRPRGCGCDPHRRHCVVSLSKVRKAADKESIQSSTTPDPGYRMGR